MYEVQGYYKLLRFSEITWVQLGTGGIASTAVRRAHRVFPRFDRQLISFSASFTPSLIKRRIMERAVLEGARGATITVESAPSELPIGASKALYGADEPEMPMTGSPPPTANAEFPRRASDCLAASDLYNRRESSSQISSRNRQITLSPTWLLKRTRSSLWEPECSA